NASAPFDQPFYILMNLAVGGPNTPYTGGVLPVDGTYTMQITDVGVFSIPKPGDMDRNGRVNAADVSAMISALSNTTDSSATYNLSAAQLALVGDVSGDGKFNGKDLQSLVNLLKAGGGSEEVPEPTALLLLSLAGLGLLAVKKRFGRQ